MAGNVSYTYDALNRLTGATYGDGTVIEYRYDAAGNRISQLVQAATTDFTLTVSKAGNGTGTVTGAGIHCGSDCTERYTAGTSVTLTATPDAGFTFSGWI
jgi:YD repeat-containing protein